MRSLRQVGDVLAERGIVMCHETVQLWWKRLRPMLVAEIRRKRAQRLRAFTQSVGISSNVVSMKQRLLQRFAALLA